MLVVSYGTEGRIGLPDKEIPPQNQIFPLIVFKGTDVKDLKVEENLVAVGLSASGFIDFFPLAAAQQLVSMGRISTI